MEALSLVSLVSGWQWVLVVLAAAAVAAYHIAKLAVYHGVTALLKQALLRGAAENHGVVLHSTLHGRSDRHPQQH